jgi:hypothetical protein
MKIIEQDKPNLLQQILIDFDKAKGHKPRRGLKRLSQGNFTRITSKDFDESIKKPH